MEDQLFITLYLSPYERGNTQRPQVTRRFFWQTRLRVIQRWKSRNTIYQKPFGNFSCVPYSGFSWNRVIYRLTIQTQIILPVPIFCSILVYAILLCTVYWTYDEMPVLKDIRTCPSCSSQKYDQGHQHWADSRRRTESKAAFKPVLGTSRFHTKGLRRRSLMGFNYRSPRCKNGSLVQPLLLASP